MKPTIGRIVIVRNLHGAGSPDEAALVTRVWGTNDPADGQPACVNVSVLADCADRLQCKTSVQMFDTRAAADAWLATMVGHAPTVCHWPDRDDQRKVDARPLLAA